MSDEKTRQEIERLYRKAGVAALGATGMGLKKAFPETVQDVQDTASNLKEQFESLGTSEVIPEGVSVKPRPLDQEVQVGADLGELLKIQGLSGDVSATLNPSGVQDYSGNIKYGPGQIPGLSGTASINPNQSYNMGVQYQRPIYNMGTFSTKASTDMNDLKLRIQAIIKF